ncbi:YkoF-like protein [Phyllosticta capitalensis]
MSQSASDTPPSALSTPPACTADFCLIPLGTPTASVSNEVAAVQRLLQKSGLKFSMHSAGTTVEGSWDDVMRLIGQCHSMLHQNGVVRIQSDIRIGTRTDKKQSFEDKVAKVQALLEQDK